MFKLLKKGFKSAVEKFSRKIEDEGRDEIIEKTKEEQVEGKGKQKEAKGKINRDNRKIGRLFKKIKEKVNTKKINEKQFEEMFAELELMLLENNVALEVIDKIKESLKIDLVNVPIEKKKIGRIIEDNLRSSIKDLFNIEEIDLIRKIKEKRDRPYVIIFLGVNGTGKTTTIAKIAKLCLDNNLTITLGAADCFRKGSIEQLEEWGKKLKIRVIKHQYESDPAAVCFDTISYAKSHNIDAVLLDTAGRQHSNKDLMVELQKIVRVSKPDLKIFVGESISGNDIVLQVNEFNSLVGIDAIILTKADIDERGGAMISVSYVTGKPVIYLGKGQDCEDLEKFNAKKIIEKIGI